MKSFNNSDVNTKQGLMIEQLTLISEELFNIKIKQLGKLLIVLSACILSSVSTIITVWTLLTKLSTIADLIKGTYSMMRETKSANFILLNLAIGFAVQAPMVYREQNEPKINTIHYVFSLIIDLMISFVVIVLQMILKCIHEDVIKTYQGPLNLSGSNHIDFRLYTNELYQSQTKNTAFVEKNMNFGIVHKHRQRHRHLQMIMLKTSKCFGSSMLFISFTTRYLFAFHLYNWLSNDYPAKELIRSSLSFIRMMQLCYRIEKLQTVNEEFLDTVNEIDLNSLDHHSRIEIMLLVKQLKLFPMVFSVNDLFLIDYNLIISVLTTTLTYILLLRQLIPDVPV